MHLLIHTQYYPPEIGAPQARLSELAAGLQQRGMQISVLTAMPNYPTGKIFPGYRRLFHKESLDGITIYRTYIVPTQSASFFLRLINYFSFVLSSFWAGLFLPKVDVILTESPPLFLCLTGFVLSRLKKARWIVNVADLWPLSAIELGLLDKDSLAYRISARLEAFAYQKAWRVTGQSRTILADIQCRFPAVQTYHLSNGVDIELFQPISAIKSSGSVQAIYAGLHGLAQGLDQVLLAAKSLQGRLPITFTFIGDGPEKEHMVRLTHDLELDNVTFLSPLPKNEIPPLLAAAEIIIVPLKVQLTGAVPSKLYEAMAVGNPIVLIAASEAAQIVKQADCGLCVSPGDVDGIARAVTILAENADERTRLGDNGRTYVVQHFDRQAIIQQFYEFLNAQE